MFCPYCGNELQSSGSYCPHCGTRLDALSQPAVPARTKKPVWHTVLAIALVVGISAFLLILTVLVLDIFLLTDKQEPQQLTAEVGQLPQEEDAGLSADSPYYQCYTSYTAFVLPDSDSTYCSRADLADLSEAELEIARQEIYARHGRTFSDGALQAYFQARSWYTPGAEDALTDCEEANLFLLDTYEKERAGQLRSNPYMQYLPDADSYVMADSSSRYLGADDLAGLDHEHLVAIRNEIFARHGYIFSSEQLKTFFYCTDWYRPDPGFSSSALNKYENANVTLCDLYERKLEGVKFSSDNPYKSYYTGASAYVMPHSASEYLYEYDLYDLPKAKAALARNEIMARHGYTFKSEDLLEYFLQCDWYCPDTPPGSSGSIKLSKIENANVETLKAYEDALAAIPDLSKLDTRLTLKVSTDAFSVYVPAYWKTYASYENMRFHMKQSSSSYDAYLFALELYAHKADFESIPSYEIWGTVTDSNGASRYLVATFPTDVQWLPGYQELYRKMYNEFERIIGTVTANTGYTYTPC